MSEWISVKDRLPEIGNQHAPYDWSEHVLCFTSQKERHICVLTNMGFWQNFTGNYHIPNEFVTHWQPLPEPPK